VFYQERPELLRGKKHSREMLEAQPSKGEISATRSIYRLVVEFILIFNFMVVKKQIH